MGASLLGYFLPAVVLASQVLERLREQAQVRSARFSGQRRHESGAALGRSVRTSRSDVNSESRRRFSEVKECAYSLQSVLALCIGEYFVEQLREFS